MPGKIMVVEDEENMRFLIVEALTNKGHDVLDVDSAEAALERIESFAPDLILMDIHLPGMSGLEALGRVNELNPLVPVIVITAFGSRDVALETIKMGAYDYFTKPIKLAELEVVVNRAIEKSRLQRRLRQLQDKMKGSYRFGGIIGQSAKMQHVLHLVDKVARFDSTVMILGESGTGKELVANAIHRRSQRSAMPLIKINCAAIPETLLESELFGHEKGAFTGAAGRKAGTFEQAHQGTLLLDEVGDMSLATQAKVLRVLEEKEMQRVGGTHTLTADVRVISATNQDLSRLTKEKRFREDLLYRLNTIPIHLPPLRERREDIPLLVDHFIREGNERLGMNISGPSQGAMERLLGYRWPGNVRELRNVLERGITLAEGPLLTSDMIAFSFEMSHAASRPVAREAPSSLRETVQKVEKNLILNALQKTGGIQAEASKLLGISEKNLWKKIRKHGIDVKQLKKRAANGK